MSLYERMSTLELGTELERVIRSDTSIQVDVDEVVEALAARKTPEAERILASHGYSAHEEE